MGTPSSLSRRRGGGPVGVRLLGWEIDGLGLEMFGGFNCALWEVVVGGVGLGSLVGLPLGLG